MEFNKENDTIKLSFREAWQIYEDCFPEDERRSLQQQTKLLSNDKYGFFSVKKSSEIIGLIATWSLDGYIFIEHFAIKNNLRNQGLGSKLIKDYLKTIDCIVVLETERPEGSSIAERRIGFWQRTGFALNNYNYIQPPYGSSKSSVPLFLMTYPKKLSVEEFEKVRKNIHIIIYGLKKPLTKI